MVRGDLAGGTHLRLGVNRYSDLTDKEWRQMFPVIE